MLFQSYKHSKMIVLMICVLAGIVFSGCGDGIKYDQGKDSYKAFGDGEYQLLRYTSISGERELCLTNCRIHTSILNNVKQFSVDDAYGYFWGDCPFYESQSSQIYVLLKLDDNHISLIYDTPEDAKLIGAMERFTSNMIASASVDIVFINHFDSEIKEKLLSLKQA